MTIQVGDRIPNNISVSTMTTDGPKDIIIDEICFGKKIVLFALPGAFTPTCSAKHLPGYIENHDLIKEKSVDTIACLSVNDVFVMDAWSKAQNVTDKILMLADGSASFTRSIGLDVDLSDKNFGIRSKRYSMIINDSIVIHLNVETGSNFEVSKAETILKLL